MPVPKHQFTLRLDNDLYDEVVQMAQSENRSLTNFIAHALRQYIAQHKPSNEKQEPPQYTPINALWKEHFRLD